MKNDSLPILSYSTPVPEIICNVVDLSTILLPIFLCDLVENKISIWLLSKIFCYLFVGIISYAHLLFLSFPNFFQAYANKSTLPLKTSFFLNSPCLKLPSYLYGDDKCIFINDYTLKRFFFCISINSRLSFSFN